MSVTESYILLNHLRFHARHGVMEQERVVGNDYDVSLRVACDIEQAMRSDDVADTISYADLYTLVAQEMSVPSQLVERVAYRIGDRIFRRYPSVRGVDIKLLKLNPPMGADCEGAGVEIHLINDKTR